MARKDIITCDRCGQEARKPHTVTIDGDERDLCHHCWQPLVQWMSHNNATVQGDANRPKGVRGPGWREVCSHHIPCGGPCPQPRYERVIS